MTNTDRVEATQQELLRRLTAAHIYAKQKDAESKQAALDRGALVEAAVLAGVSYADIGLMLYTDENPDGLSRQNVQKLRDRYYRALHGRTRPDRRPRRGQEDGK